MFKKTLISTLLAGFIIIVMISTRLFSYPGGAPPAKTGSPADVSTCTSCHDASVIKKDGMITSDAPGGFYEAGKTYTITAAAAGSTNTKRIGFEVSPQDMTGKLLGTLTLLNKDETKLVGKGKYITHTDKGSKASGSKSWTFSWTAPAAGTGDVTFYGAFLIADAIQVVVTSTLTLKEKK